MLKKLIFSLFIFSLVTYQLLFMNALRSGGIMFNIKIWRAFGIEQTAFSKFIYANIDTLFWFSPAICVGFYLFSLWKFNLNTILLTTLLTITMTGILLWSTYNPSMMILIS